jgi:hypothetical protein
MCVAFKDVANLISPHPEYLTGGSEDNSRIAAPRLKFNAGVSFVLPRIRDCSHDPAHVPTSHITESRSREVLAGRALLRWLSPIYEAHTTREKPIAFM